MLDIEATWAPAVQFSMCECIAPAVQEAGSTSGGVQKSVKTGVANALLAMLKITAAEAVPWRRKVCDRLSCTT